MSKMQTVAHFELDMPGATTAEMHQSEQLMRDPAYVAEVLASINEIAEKHAKAAGIPHPIHITGSIHAVTHVP